MTNLYFTFAGWVLGVCTIFPCLLVLKHLAWMCTAHKKRTEFWETKYVDLLDKYKELEMSEAAGQFFVSNQKQYQRSDEDVEKDEVMGYSTLEGAMG